MKKVFWLLFVFAGLIAGTGVHAQQTVTPCVLTGVSPGNVAGCVPTSSSTAQYAGHLTISATTTSALVSTGTANAAGGNWPAMPGQVWVFNWGASAGVVYICPNGGTCSASGATAGIPVAQGNGYGVFRPSTAMTIVAATTATVTVQY